MRKYYTISWKILTVQEACPYYQSQEDQKQLRYVRIGEEKEILQYKFLPEEAIRQVGKIPALAIWAYQEDDQKCEN